MNLSNFKLLSEMEEVNLLMEEKIADWSEWDAELITQRANGKFIEVEKQALQELEAGETELLINTF